MHASKSKAIVVRWLRLTIYAAELIYLRLIHALKIPLVIRYPAAGGVLLYNIPAGATLRVRLNEPGDRFQPQWRDAPIKLKEFLRGQKLPWQARSNIAVIMLLKPSSNSDATNSDAANNDETVKADEGGSTSCGESAWPERNSDGYCTEAVETSASSEACAEVSVSDSESEIQMVAVYSGFVSSQAAIDTIGVQPVWLTISAASAGVHDVRPRPESPDTPD